MDWNCFLTSRRTSKCFGCMWVREYKTDESWDWHLTKLRLGDFSGTIRKLWKKVRCRQADGKSLPWGQHGELRNMRLVLVVINCGVWTPQMLLYPWSCGYKAVAKLSVGKLTSRITGPDERYVYTGPVVCSVNRKVCLILDLSSLFYFSLFLATSLTSHLPYPLHFLPLS